MDNLFYSSYTYCGSGLVTQLWLCFKKPKTPTKINILEEEKTLHPSFIGNHGVDIFVFSPNVSLVGIF